VTKLYVFLFTLYVLNVIYFEKRDIFDENYEVAALLLKYIRMKINTAFSNPEKVNLNDLK